jgi:hypothetical protein
LVGGACALALAAVAPLLLPSPSRPSPREGDGLVVAA